MNLDELAAKAKKELDNDPDLIIETDIEEGRLIICRTGVDEDDYRVSLEKQIEVEDEDGNMDEFQPGSGCEGGSDNIMGLVSGSNIYIANTK